MSTYHHTGTPVFPNIWANGEPFPQRTGTLPGGWTITLHSALAIFNVKRLCGRVFSLAMENTFFIDNYLLNHNQFWLYCAHMIVTWQAINTPWTPFISRSIHHLLFSSTCLAGRTFKPCENKPLTNHSEYVYPCLAVLDRISVHCPYAILHI